MTAAVQMVVIVVGVLGLGLAFWLQPKVALACLVHRSNKARRRQVPIVVSLGAPAPAAPTRVSIDLRTREQRLEDQTRVNQLGFPRGVWAS